MTAPPPVAIAVVSWNTRDALARCLRALEPEARAGRAAVVVVDNASTDGSAELVRERFGWAELVASERNLGYGRAVNLAAARHPSAGWVVAANADTEPEPGSLEALLDAGRRHPGAGALAPLLRLPDGTIQHSAYAFPTLPFTLAFNSGLAALSRRLADRLCLEGAWDPRREREVPWAIAAFLAIRREAWDAVGGFDEEQWMYAEDLDLGWRLRQAGWRTVHVPGAVVRHGSAASTAQAWGAERDARWLASTYAWMLRRRGGVRTRLAAAINLAGAGARFAAYAAGVALGRNRFAAPRDANRRWLRLHLAGLRSRARLVDEA